MFNLTSLILLNTDKQLTNTTDNGIIYSEVTTMKFMTTKEVAAKWGISERIINTIDYIGLWEEIHNQDFNLVEFN